MLDEMAPISIIAGKNESGLHIISYIKVSASQDRQIQLITQTQMLYGSMYGM